MNYLHCWDTLQRDREREGERERERERESKIELLANAKRYFSKKQGILSSVVSFTS